VRKGTLHDEGSRPRLLLYSKFVGSGSEGRGQLRPEVLWVEYEQVDCSHHFQREVVW